jgi:tetratricopeptide (TPR) repeat protein
MSSLIEGYNYDIFISYRQKDNKGDRWVSEFVEALKTELESTFKEEISVYFDINPSDYLLESYDVDASLKEKLKCLVFIPIISRTYCDPKSFAWEYEFKPFVEQASKDQFGLKVKLPNGNVANRVLPVRIHDLDIADIKECESVLGGVLRGIEFIYKESGIDKPLTPGDDEKKNSNNTKYRIQLIKVAHAIKEIILGMKTEPVQDAKERDQPKESPIKISEEVKKIDVEKPSKLIKWKLLSVVVILAIIIAAILTYPKIFKRDKLENLRSSDGRIPIAVMPFQNLTSDTTWNYWQIGIQDDLINYLSNFSEELKVKQIELTNNLLQNKGFTNFASLTPSAASTISQKLDANVFIYGTIKKAGSMLRINAQLIDSKTQEVFKSFQIDGTAENVMHISDSLPIIIKNHLLISILKKENIEFQGLTSTNSPEAYKNFIYGKNAYYKSDYSASLNYFKQALAIDSNFIWAERFISTVYKVQGNHDEAKKWFYKVYEKRDVMSLQQKIWTDISYAGLFQTPNEEIKYLKQLLEIDDQLPPVYFNLGNDYNKLYQYKKAIPEFEKALEIYDKWHSKPLGVGYYLGLGLAYHKTELYKKERKLYKKAEQDFPDYPSLIYRQAVLALYEGKTKEANDYIEKFKSISKDNSVSEANISSDLATMYNEADLLNEAEAYYRKVLSFEPKNQARMNSLAYFLIDKDRNINEGLQLVDTVLKLSPDNYSYLHTKGWGLYKQDKYKEALDILQKSWDLRMDKAVYNHEAWLHREAAKNAVAGLK